MSKRGLKKLIDGKIVRGWDDPRLYTLIALRRRGVPPGAILSFINELGVTTTNSLIQVNKFEQSVRKYLETSVPRLMMVLEPLRVVIEDADSLESTERDLSVPFSPKQPEFGNHTVHLTNTVFIDRCDFREVDSKDYFRLAPGKTVGLFQMPYPITATSFSKDEAGNITEVRAVFSKEGKKPKTYIQWVPEGSRKVEVRVHTALFKSENPAGVEGGFMNDISPNSETIYTDALIEPGFEEIRSRAPWPAAEGEKDKHGPESVRFQGLRIAYFVRLLFPSLTLTWKQLTDIVFLLYRPSTPIQQMTRLFSTASFLSRKMRERVEQRKVRKCY